MMQSMQQCVIWTWIFVTPIPCSMQQDKRVSLFASLLFVTDPFLKSNSSNFLLKVEVSRKRSFKWMILEKFRYSFVYKLKNIKSSDWLKGLHFWNAEEIPNAYSSGQCVARSHAVQEALRTRCEPPKLQSSAKRATVMYEERSWHQHYKSDMIRSRTKQINIHLYSPLKESKLESWAHQLPKWCLLMHWLQIWARSGLQILQHQSYFETLDSIREGKL